MCLRRPLHAATLPYGLAVPIRPWKAAAKAKELEKEVQRVEEYQARS